MLNDFLAAFIGAFASVVPETYRNYNWFISILSIIILSVVCASMFITFFVVLHSVIKYIVGKDFK